MMQLFRLLLPVSASIFLLACLNENEDDDGGKNCSFFETKLLKSARDKQPTRQAIEHTHKFPFASFHYHTRKKYKMDNKKNARKRTAALIAVPNAN